MKKRSMAIALAAVSVAPVVAPAATQVFAAEKREEREVVIRPEDYEAKLKELNIAKKLNMKFSDVVENGDLANKKVFEKITFAIYEREHDRREDGGKEKLKGQYTIVNDLTNSNDENEVTVKQFEEMVEGLKIGEVLRLTLNGYEYTEQNNQVLAKQPTYRRSTIDGLHSQISRELDRVLNGYWENRKYVQGWNDIEEDYQFRFEIYDREVISDEESSIKVKIIASDVNKEDNSLNKEYVIYDETIKTGDVQIDFNRPIFDKTNPDKYLKGFELKQPYNQETEDEVVVFSNSTIEMMDVSELFDGKVLTEKAHELISKSDIVVEKQDGKREQIISNGLVVYGGKTEDIIHEYKDIEGYAIRLFERDTQLARGIIGGDLKEIIVTSDSKNKLIELVKQMKFFKHADFTMFGTEKGDRFDTAIEVSQNLYKKDGEALAVVLTGANAIVDGLAAGPLASAEKAPILLTNRDEINVKTMNEIDRVLGAQGKTIFLIGDEEIISKDIENTLKAKKLNVIRLGGATRVETSLAIANYLAKEEKIDNQAFVVGYRGEADAMSVASVASRNDSRDERNVKVSPIIVSDQKEMTKEALEFIDKNIKGKTGEVAIIGDNTVVSANSEYQLRELLGTSGFDKDKENVIRLAGEDRQDTNAKVIDRYFAKNTIESVVVTKDGRKNTGSQEERRIGDLVDALVAAPYASSKNAPIVLATNNLAESQEKELREKTTHWIGFDKNRLVQVGHGVASSVINKIILNLRH